MWGRPRQRRVLRWRRCDAPAPDRMYEPRVPGKLAVVDRRVTPVGQVAMFVIDGHDIETLPGCRGRGRRHRGVRRPKAPLLRRGRHRLASDRGRPGLGGPITLHRTRDNRLDELIRLLGCEADDRASHFHLGLRTTPRSYGERSWQLSRNNSQDATPSDNRGEGVEDRTRGARADAHASS